MAEPTDRPEWQEKLDGFKGWLTSLRPDERAARMADAETKEGWVEEATTAVREKPTPDAGAALLEELDARVAELRAREVTDAEVKRAACAFIATHVGRLYGVTVSDRETRKVVTAVQHYGSRAVRDAAVDLLSDGYDPKVRNIWALLNTRACMTERSGEWH